MPGHAGLFLYRSRSIDLPVDRSDQLWHGSTSVLNLTRALKSVFVIKHVARRCEYSERSGDGKIRSDTGLLVLPDS